MRNKREKLKAEIANLARAIAEGHRSAALLDELGKRERELDDISEELLAADGRGLDARFREIEEFVQKRLQDIRGLLFADVPRAKAELSKHCTAITLTLKDRRSQSRGLEPTRRTFGWCRGRGAGALQVAAGGQRFVGTGFGGALEAPDFVPDAPDHGTVGIFLALGFVGLLQVISAAFKDHASFCRVQVHNHFRVPVARVRQAAPGAHHVG